MPPGPGAPGHRRRRPGRRRGGAGGSRRFSAATLDEVDAHRSSGLVELAGVARHEARHAEQWFRMAQLRVAQGRSGAEVAAEMWVPPDIADAAVARPLVPGEVAEAERWWQRIGLGQDQSAVL